jgi:hypothetical protein
MLRQILQSMGSDSLESGMKQIELRMGSAADHWQADSLQEPEMNRAMASDG